jgi:conserved oligomeric Golgi complex subunit 2
VDNFLDNQGTNFETLRDDLGRYLKDLRSAMIELINQDYSDFVNLSSNLIGLDKSILKLRVPLCQFKEEILVLKNCINILTSTNFTLVASQVQFGRGY